MRQKTIFIEGLGLVEGHFSGVGQYILGVLRGLDEMIDNAEYAGEPHPEVKVIIPYNTVHTFKKFNFKHIQHKKFPLSFKIMGGLWYKGLLPPIDIWCGRGAYIFTRFVNMPLLFNKSATVIYDLSFELYGQYSEERNREFLSKRVRDTIKTTSKIIAISENAKSEIVDFYKLDESKVIVATPATDPRSFYRRSQREIDWVKQSYGIDGDYILALSNLEPRKNLEALVEAYCRLPESERTNLELVLVGVSGWKTEKLFQDILQKVEAGYNIMRPSKYVRDEDKPAIISGAKMLVYPSHYEGFGMPPLEALACGVPVITADNSSQPEVVGSVGKMVPSENQELLLEYMKDYLDNIEEITKKTIIDGPRRAKGFSWGESAKTFMKIATGL